MLFRQASVLLVQVGSLVLLAAEASEHRTFCPFVLKEYFDKGCIGAVQHETELFATNECLEDDEWGPFGPGKYYSAYCSTNNTFVFETSG